MYSNNPLISIIIPVYNVEKYVAQCVQSVLNQTYDNIECLIIDDCGSDSSIQICEKIINGYMGDKHIKIIHRKTNGGLSEARNTGLDSAHGDYIYFLDGDDSLFSDAMESMARIIIDHRDIELVIGNFFYPANPERYNFQFCKNINYIKGHKIGEYLFFSDFIPTNATDKLIRSDIAKNNKFTSGIIHEDEMWMYSTCQQIGEIAFTCSHTYNRIDNPKSIMSTTTLNKTGHFMGMIINNILNNLPNEFRVIAILKYLNRFLVYYHFMTIDKQDYEMMMQKFIEITKECGLYKISRLLKFYRSLKLKSVAKAFRRYLMSYVNHVKMSYIVSYNSK